MAEVVKLRRPATRDHLRAKPRSQRIVEIHLAADALQAFTDAEEAVGKAQLRASANPKPSGVDKELRAAQATRDATKAVLDESTVEILLQSVGRRRYEELERQHPPTPKQLEEWQEQVAQADERIRHMIQRPPHDVDGFSVALIAASAVEPSLSEEEWREILDEWTPAEGNKLKMVAFQVNNVGELVELGKASSSSGSNGTRG